MFYIFDFLLGVTAGVVLSWLTVSGVTVHFERKEEKDKEKENKEN